MLNLILLLFFPDPALLAHPDFATREAATRALTHPAALPLLWRPMAHPEAEWRRQRVWTRLTVRVAWVRDAVELTRFFADKTRFLTDPEAWLDRVDRYHLFFAHGEWTARQWVWDVPPTVLPDNYVWVCNKAHEELIRRVTYAPVSGQ